MVLASGNTSGGSLLPTTTFNVTLVLENIELTDEHLDRVFAALPDAVPANVGGVVTLTSPVDAPNAEAAASTSSR